MDDHGGAKIRELARDEIERVREIDRRELIEAVYRFEDGGLILVPERHDMAGWPPGSIEGHLEALLGCFDEGGTVWGAFVEDGRFVGIAALTARFFGPAADRLQLLFLHVSHGFRDRGIGKRLFLVAAERARERGTRMLYVSAVPSEHTVGFYRGLGCVPVAEPDPELFAEEPEDIHLEYELR
jgi:ribosomal protein S18 acetylase RimI-like enzyme